MVQQVSRARAPGGSRGVRLRRLGIGGSIGAVILIIIAVTSVMIQFVGQWDPSTPTPAGPLAGMSSEHMFGTDLYGRDLFTRVAYGARVSLAVGLSVSVAATAVGLFCGVIAAYYGGIIDVLISRVVDAFLAIPHILFAIAILAILGSGLPKVIIALIVVYCPLMTRVTRGASIAINARPHVRAARAIGASNMRIIFRHIIPHVLGPVVVQATFVFAIAMLYEALLSFLGLGVTPPTPSFGNIVDESLEYIFSDVSYVLLPSAVLTVTVYSINLVGDAIRDRVDPRGSSVL